MSKLWKPDDAGKVIPVVRVRPLLPPPPQAGVRLQPQHLHWQVGRYKEDLSFGPGGRGRRKRWVVDMEAEQHNIVLNNAYELMPVHGITPLTSYAVVGTGSTPPDPSQLALANEVRRTNRNETGGTGGFSYTRVANGVYEQTVVREFLETEVGNQNLTEWGFSPVGTAGANLMSRELFRDGNGNPIVISPASDQRLRLIYKTRITLSPVVPVPVSIDISGIGIRSGLAVLTLSTGGAGGSFPDLVVVELAMTGTVIKAEAALHRSTRTSICTPLPCRRLILTQPATQVYSRTKGPASRRTPQTPGRGKRTRLLSSAAKAMVPYAPLGSGRPGAAVSALCLIPARSLPRPTCTS